MLFRSTEIRVAPGDVAEVMRTLHDGAEFHFRLLADIAGVDTGATMQVVYHLWSDTSPDWLRVVAVGLERDDPRVPSVTFLWKGAEWGEREAYDMFGIVFTGHSDLRRILLPDDWVGFPLRKYWVDPDFYNGMHVKPTAQMAERAMGGEAIGVGPFDFTPPNRHVKE